MSPSLSVVLAFRDRELERARRCLDSLAAQRGGDFEILFVDFGSAPALREPLRRLAEATGARYLHSETRGHPWNRAQALNAGARHARGPFLLTTDVDLVFPPGCLAGLAAAAREGQVAYLAPVDLPRGFDAWDDPAAAAGQPLFPRTAYGTCQLVAREVFARLGGFDENYRYWGIEDRDLHRRLLAAGLSEVWLDDVPRPLHQWHPPADVKTRGFLPAGVWGRMELHYFRHLGEIERNGDGWGRLLTAAERPALAFVDDEAGRLATRPDLHRFAADPYAPRSIGALLAAFWELPPGAALAVGGAFLPRRRRAADLVLRALRRPLRWAASALAYRPNVLHGFVAELAHRRPPELLDYYLDVPEGDGVSVLVRGGGDGSR